MLFISALIVIATEHFNYPDTLKYHNKLLNSIYMDHVCMVEQVH